MAARPLAARRRSAGRLALHVLALLVEPRALDVEEPEAWARQGCAALRLLCALDWPARGSGTAINAVG